MGWHREGVRTWTPHEHGSSWQIDAEVIANAVWRHGRLFFRCRACSRYATRLCVPLPALDPRCRRCWGLNYARQSWSYSRANPWAALLGPVAYVTTEERRRERREASREGYAVRRALPANKG
jgi:hypothetical protein